MRIVVGLGGNLGEVAAAFARARSELAACGPVVAASGVWRTRAQGPAQDDFLNAALLLELRRHPLELLALTQRIEDEAGRDRRREARWGPRLIDLDLLIADALVVVAPALSLPHPRLAERRFALLPASEVAAEWVHPRLHRTVAELAAAIPAELQPCARVGPFPEVP